jgi:5-methylthioadenosine/S-adenosylhomocysteine deaminase
MSFVPADLRIEVRWIAPMSARDRLLEEHSLMVRGGRILDILPTAIARERYADTTVLERNTHLLMPGMINTQSDAAMALYRGAAPVTNLADGFAGAEFARDSMLAAIAEMLKSGITCFFDRGDFPEETALAANDQGMRATLGMPVDEQSLTRSLNLRDAYLGHPLISTAFAPRGANTLSDEIFSRLATLADELDAGITMDLHQSSAEIHECLARFGVRPIERLWNLGLLTPAFNAVHMAQVTGADIELARRTGISISLCPQADLKSGNGLPPVGAFAAAGIRLGVGSAGSGSTGLGVWGEMKLLALLANAGADAGLTPWEALNIATRGGAAVLGLEDEVGTLEIGKWADLCCVDLAGPATQPLRDPLAQLVFNGGRDAVADVWVAGRQLLAGGELTRLDWPCVRARAEVWAARMSTGG